MRTLTRTAPWLLLLLAGCGGAAPAPTAEPAALLAPPEAPRRPYTHAIAGHELTDDYYWLREREDPETLAYLEAENAYTEARMAHTTALQEELFEEMRSRVLEDDNSVPYADGGYYYYFRTETGLEYPIFCRKEGSLEAVEQVLLDQNTLVGEGEFMSVGVLEVSPDHNLLAYGIDRDGDELFEIHFRDLSTGRDRDEVIEDSEYGFAWANDNETVFYTTIDEAHRPYRVWRYRLGSDPSSAELVYEEPDEMFHLTLGRTRSNAYIVLSLYSSITSEQHVLAADDPTGAFTVVQPRMTGVEYSIDHHGEHFWVLTNLPESEGGEPAYNFRLLETPVATPGREHWMPVIGHDPDVYIVSFDAFAGHLVLWERAAGLPRIRIRDLSTGEDHVVEQPEPTYDAYAETNAEFDTTQLRFNYASLVTPRSVIGYDMATRERTVLREHPVIGYDRTSYVSERLVATADDGAQVPISLVYRRGVALDGTAPMYLTGYGAYGYPYDVYFSSPRLSLLDRGVIYAIAHIRGGGEMGRLWYESGKLLNKRNTFTDFIDCAEHLIAEGYTSSDRLAIEGASAGGLLIGAVTTMRPDLFAVVVAQVPFVDVVTTMADASIPLTAIEWEEWGNPNEAEHFDYMLSYSPMDNVRAADYPDMLVTAGLNDPRVMYWEPAKWVARLRAVWNDPEDVLLLRTEMGSGHFGVSGRFGQLREEAFIYAFVLDRLGVTGTM